MVNIYQHTQYCEGRGYVNPHSFADAMAKEKTDNRLNRDATALLMQGRQAMADKGATQTALNQQTNLALLSRLPQPIALFAGRAQQFIQQQLARVLPQAFVANTAQLAQNLQQSPNFLARAAGQVLGFFFSGSKKARGEYDDDDAELREANDLDVQDNLFFTELKAADASTMSKES